MKTISIIVPAYNEEEALPLAIRRVAAATEPLAARYRFEFLILDNSSEDRTGEIARAQCAADRRWKYLRYSRNFGSEASMLAGLDHARGDAVINIFSDLQDPPEMIPLMVEKWEAGAQVVCGVLRVRNDYTWLKTIGAKIAYKMIRHLAQSEMPENVADLRLLDRTVVDVLCRLREPDRYLRGLVHWVGFRRETFVYDRSPRAGGASSANIAFCVAFAMRAVVAFSSRPMRLAMYFGLFLSLGSVLLGMGYAVLHYARPAFLAAAPPGLTSVLLLICFGIGVNSLFLGIIGEYIGRIYNQGKQRPLYVVAEKINLD